MEEKQAPVLKPVSVQKVSAILIKAHVSSHERVLSGMTSGYVLIDVAHPDVKAKVEKALTDAGVVYGPGNRWTFKCTAIKED